MPAQNACVPVFWCEPAPVKKPHTAGTTRAWYLSMIRLSTDPGRLCFPGSGLDLEHRQKEPGVSTHTHIDVSLLQQLNTERHPVVVFLFV